MAALNRQATARSKRQKTADRGRATREAAHEAPTTRPAGSGSKRLNGAVAVKQAQVVAMLKAPNGATIEKIAAVTGWQHHSIRGFLTAVIRKRLGLDLVSETSSKGRVYRIVDRPASLLASVETNKPM
jgi:Protein of unknown function (DUF3489)